MDQREFQFHVELRDGTENGTVQLLCHDRNYFKTTAYEIYESTDREQLWDVAKDWLMNNSDIESQKCDVFVDAIFSEWEWQGLDNFIEKSGCTKEFDNGPY